MKTILLDSVDSTNLYARQFSEDVTVIAREQTAGRGTKGRSFSSPRGGLYLTQVRHDLDFSAEEIFRIMVNSSVAVAKTAEAFSLKPTIKWPNDVHLNGRKVCGILIENTISGKKITASRVGIGVNINNALPDDLKEIAISFREAGGKEYHLEEVERVLLKNLEQKFDLATYKQYLVFLGKTVRILGETEHVGIARDVDPLGRLILEEDGVLTPYAWGEVSLRL